MTNFLTFLYSNPEIDFKSLWIFDTSPPRKNLTLSWFVFSKNPQNRICDPSTKSISNQGWSKKQHEKYMNSSILVFENQPSLASTGSEAPSLEPITLRSCDALASEVLMEGFFFGILQWKMLGREGNVPGFQWFLLGTLMGSRDVYPMKLVIQSYLIHRIYGI